VLWEKEKEKTYTVYCTECLKDTVHLIQKTILAATPADWIQEQKSALQFLAEKGYQQVAVFGFVIEVGGDSNQHNDHRIYFSKRYILFAQRLNDGKLIYVLPFLRYVRHVKKTSWTKQMKV